MHKFMGLFLLLGINNMSDACTQTGRFPNNSEPECRGFVMCLKGAAGFMQYNLVCPEHAIYSHIDNQCTNVTEYKCWPNYKCTKEENIVEPSNENCTSFISCVKDFNNTLLARLIECPVNMVFNGSTCVEKDVYQCPKKTETTNTVHVTIDNFSGNFTLNSVAPLSIQCLTVGVTIYLSLMIL
ncbi:uncharacterized protein LOC119833543 [Zerene cesonia]|uniref:uncharacterized protein LOC119833543 n=1 Tax=Zerene cesonia TaxID=33412 RepID=UPI0018E5161A|nr:uncharacterized protein LOC119833543 [Zerene cesonia]